MNKVLFVATVVKTHINSFHLPFLKMFKDGGYETSVCARNDFKNKDDLEIPNCDKYYDLPFERMPFKPNNLKAFFKLRKLMHTENFNIVHCHTPAGGVLARLASIGLRKHTRVIYTAHGFHFYKGAPKINWLIYFPIEWVCSFLTDTLITMNKEDYNFALKHMHAGEILYVPGVGVDIEGKKSIDVDRKSKRAELGIGESDIAVISVGELNENKNHEVVIKALAEVKNKKIVYLICGIGDKKGYLEKLAQELGVRLMLLGFRDDVSEIYNCSDICAFPSKREGLSLALMEAMATGCPIICSKIRGNVDLVKDGEGGFLCSPESHIEFADAIGKLLEDKALMDKMSVVNRKNSEKYDLSAIKEEMRKIYKL